MPDELKEFFSMAGTDHCASTSWTYDELTPEERLIWACEDDPELRGLLISRSVARGRKEDVR